VGFRDLGDVGMDLLLISSEAERGAEPKLPFRRTGSAQLAAPPGIAVYLSKGRLNKQVAS
jgi:hypothetical protein